MKFYIETLGCKVNSYESNYIMKSLINNGFLNTNDYKDADIIIVNTCTVTNTSDTKCLKRVRKFKRETNAIICVCGCSVQYNYKRYIDYADIILGNKNKSKISELIKKFINTKEKYIYVNNNRNYEFENMSINKFNHTRAFIKIQDGCDNFCSYCIIPFVRGKCSSKKFDDIINEAKSLVLNNHKEIVLTGIHTGSYNDNGKDLCDLIYELSKIENLDRIRLSSVEITELNDKFINLLKSNTKLVDHLHIPMQSGSDKILKLMNRKYDTKYFIDKINTIRKIKPDISITTDLIIGHPSENEKDFLDTIEFINTIKFSKLHVFPYSDRNGTKSSLMNDKVDEKTKKDRVNKIIRLNEILEKEYRDKFINKEVKVLIEEVKDNISIGHTSNYLKVEINNKYNPNDYVYYLLDK